MTDHVAEAHLRLAVNALPEQQFMRAFVSVLHGMWKMQRRHHWRGTSVDEYGVVHGWGSATPLAQVYRVLRDRARQQALSVAPEQVVA